MVFALIGLLDAPAAFARDAVVSDARIPRYPAGNGDDPLHSSLRQVQVPGSTQALPVGGITIGDKSDMVRISVFDSSDLSHVTFSRAADAVGRPIDYSRVRSAISVSLPRMAFPGQLPLSVSAMTSGFGVRVHPLLGGYRMHSGVDLAAPIGTPIHAPSDGVVGSAQWRGGYGLSGSLEHGGGIETRYGHMSNVNVFAGQRVRKGDTIGFVGSTGLSTGPHLHYEMRVNGQAVNPVSRRKP